jgi:NAD(P)-dependent dehydrogenase (short-subunit alcohol dehydrogenase family)
MSNLKNKVVLLTGVGKGIGRSIFEDCLKKGAYVYAITRSKKNIENFNNLSKFRDRYQIFFFDVNNIQNIKKIMAKSVKDKNMINCLINNAGIRQRQKFINISKKELLDIFKTNFFSIFLIIQLYIKYLIKHKIKKSSVVNLGSIVGNKGFTDLSGYASTKTALIGLTKCLAVEYANKNYRFNIVSPGFIKTSYYNDFKKNKKLYDWTKSKIPMKRWGNTSEISSLVNFLISDRSEYLTGQEIFIDGGWTV